MALPDLPPVPEDALPAEYVASQDPYEVHEDVRALDDDLDNGPVPRRSEPPMRNAPRDPIDTDLVRRLADILADTELSEIEVEKGDLKIRVARQTTVAAMAAPIAVAAPMTATSSAAASPALVGANPAVTTNEELRGEIVKSPMVGAVYLQATPGAKRFVQPGEQVTAGQTLMIIEAMKTMNPVPAPRDGKVSKVMVEDGQPVEFGEPLLVIE